MTAVLKRVEEAGLIISLKLGLYSAEQLSLCLRCIICLSKDTIILLLKTQNG